MGLVQCPDCERLISDAAANCIGCGRPMGSNLAVAAPSLPARRAGLGPPSTGRGGLGRCGQCGSEDVRRVQLAYEEGTTFVDETSSGRTVGIVGDDLAVGRSTTTTKGTRHTELAKRLAPPQPRGEDGGGAALGCAGVAVAAIIAGATIGSGGFFGITVVGLIGLAALGQMGAFKLKDNVIWNRDELPRLTAAWQRSVLCMRCGAVTDPEEKRTTRR